MSKAWSEVTSSSDYQGLPAGEQEAVRRQYFGEVIAPKVPEEEHGAAWEQFNASKPSEPTRQAQTQGPSLARGLTREAVQGASFEFGDEIGLGAAALAAKTASTLGLAPDTGQPLGKIYQDMRGHYEAEREQFKEAHPVSAVTANIAGSMSPASLGAKLISKAAPLGKLATTGALAATGAIQGALFGAGAAKLGERLDGAATGAAIGAVATPAAGAVLNGASRAIAQHQAAKQIGRLTPERDELHAAAKAVYAEADQLGVVMTAEKTGQIQAQLAAMAKQEGFNARIHPKVAAALDSFDDLAGDVPTLARMDQQRRILGAAAKSMEPDERRVASELIGHFDDLIMQLKPTDVTSGNVVKAGKLLRHARGLWQKQSKLGVIDDAIERSMNQASGFENGLRTQFRSILNSPKKMRGFTLPEKNAMQQIVRGGTTENTLRLLGRLGWGDRGATNVVGAAIGATAGLASGGGFGAVAVPVMGQIARRGAEFATRRNMEQLQKLVAAGAHPRFIVNRYAKDAGPKATAEELRQFLVTAPDQDLLSLAAKLNDLKGPNRTLALDALALAASGKAAQGQDEQ